MDGSPLPPSLPLLSGRPISVENVGFLPGMVPALVSMLCFAVLCFAALCSHGLSKTLDQLHGLSKTLGQLHGFVANKSHYPSLLPFGGQMRHECSTHKMIKEVVQKACLPI